MAFGFAFIALQSFLAAKIVEKKRILWVRFPKDVSDFLFWETLLQHFVYNGNLKTIFPLHWVSIVYSNQIFLRPEFFTAFSIVLTNDNSTYCTNVSPPKRGGAFPAPLTRGVPIWRDKFSRVVRPSGHPQLSGI